MYEPPTMAETSMSGLADSIFEMVESKLVTSSGKKSIDCTDPPFSCTNFFTHCKVT